MSSNWEIIRRGSRIIAEVNVQKGLIRIIRNRTPHFINLHDYFNLSPKVDCPVEDENEHPQRYSV